MRHTPGSLDRAIADTPQTPDDRLRSVALAALAALTVLRLVVAAVTPLSPDEAYYWIWSRALAPGYLDHPPMVALWVRVGTALLGDTPLGVRLLAPLSAAIGTLALADAGRRLFPGRGAGLRAAVLLNATLMFAAGAVTMTPDTPLLFFWTGTIWALARIGTGAAGAWWLAVGVLSGLALDSKYTAALLGAGIAAWLLMPAMRPWLRTPWPWAGGLVAGALFLPVLAWNATNGWVSFVKQGGRSGDWAPANAGRYLGELVAGQVGLATPIVAVLFGVGLVGLARRWRDPGAALVLALVLPGTLLFVEHAIGDRVQANWVAILYPGAALAAGAFGARWWRPAAALGGCLGAILYGQATLAPIPLPRAIDPTLRLTGWPELADEAAAMARQNVSPCLASEDYGVASLLAWSAALSHSMLPVIAAGPRWTTFMLPRPESDAACLLLVSQRRNEPPSSAYWQTSVKVGAISRRRGTREIERFDLYRVERQPNGPSAILSDISR